MEFDFPTAKKGEPFTAEKWNAAQRAVRSLRLFSGPGIRLQVTPAGTIIAAANKGTPWDHPFRVTLMGETKAEITPGFINGNIEPKIKVKSGEIPMSGTDKERAPFLEWGKPKLDKDGAGYIAVEVVFTEQWTLTKDSGTKIVQVAYFDSEDGVTPPKNDGKSGGGGVPILTGRRARWPLARLVKHDGQPLEIFQITQGDLQCRAQPRDAKALVGRVFFW